MGGDYKIAGGNAYQGAYSNGDRIGFGVERDPDGVYPGRYGFVTDSLGKPHNIELSGTQDFRGRHWAGRYGFYTGPRIACTLIKGAVLEGSALDGPGAKFDSAGRVTEQANYRAGLGRAGPPC